MCIHADSEYRPHDFVEEQDGGGLAINICIVACLANRKCIWGTWRPTVCSRIDINAAHAAIGIARGRLEINTHEKLKEEETGRVQLDTLGSIEGAVKSEGSDHKRQKKR